MRVGGCEAVPAPGFIKRLEVIMRQKQMLAADFGASSGRVMMGNYDGSRIEIKQMHRFLNEPVYLSGTLYWDFLRLFHELKIGIGKASKQGKPESIGVDTWGVDFGFLDKDGFLMENPVNYRDKRTEGMLKETEKYLSFDRFYKITGNQFMEINTAFQLLSLKKCVRRCWREQTDCCCFRICLTIIYPERLSANIPLRPQLS